MQQRAIILRNPSQQAEDTTSKSPLAPVELTEANCCRSSAGPERQLWTSAARRPNGNW
jgi:hypothetical protein